MDEETEAYCASSSPSGRSRPVILSAQEGSTPGSDAAGDAEASNTRFNEASQETSLCHRTLVGGTGTLLGFLIVNQVTRSLVPEGPQC